MQEVVRTLYQHHAASTPIQQRLTTPRSFTVPLVDSLPVIRIAELIYNGFGRQNDSLPFVSLSNCVLRVRQHLFCRPEMFCGSKKTVIASRGNSTHWGPLTLDCN